MAGHARPLQAMYASPISPALFSVLLEEVRDGHYALVVILERVFFIRRMQAVIGQAKAHQNRGNAEVSCEVADNGNRATAANEYRRLLKNVAERAGGHLDRGMLGIHDQPRRCS